MKLLKRFLVFILFSFALLYVVAGLNLRIVYAVEYAPVLSEDFESYATGTGYQSTKEYDDNHWVVYFGTVSTTAKLSGSNSIHMRYYKNKTNEYPYLEYTFDSLTTIDKIEFKYAVSNTNLEFSVKYSSNGDTYNLVESVSPDDTSTISYSKVLASSISVLKFKIEVNSGITAPTGDYYTFRVDDVVLSTESSAPQLSAPTNASISGNVLSFNAVANAVSYNVGFFASESAANPTKVVNINSTSYSFTQQSADGNNYIKIQAVGNNVDYISSNYTYVGTYTYTDIPVKTIAQADALPTETVEPYSYYDITGTVSRITNVNSSRLYITDGNTELYIYGLRATKNGNIASTTSLGIEEGFTIRIRAYKTIYSTTIEFCGYLVSVTPNYTNQFVALNTVASLKVNYTSNMGTAPANSQAAMTKPATTINTASNTSYSLDLGFNPSMFKITCEKNNGSNPIALRNDEIRLYAEKTNGNGCEMRIEGVNGITIRKLVLTYSSDSSKTEAISGTCNFETSNDGLTYTYFFSSATPYVTIKNVNIDNTQVKFTAMTIYYSGSYASSYTINTELSDKPMVSLMFGGILSSTLKDNLDSTGTSVTYGVVYAKTSTLTTLSKTLEQALEAGDAGIYTVAGTPVKVNSDGTENPEGAYYQVGVALNHISESNYDTEITAATYVCIDGTYSLMNVKAYSVKSIARAYSSADCTSYSEHLGVLGYLANYVNQ